MVVSDGRSPVTQRKGLRRPQTTPALADNDSLQAVVVAPLVEEEATYTSPRDATTGATFNGSVGPNQAKRLVH